MFPSNTNFPFWQSFAVHGFIAPKYTTSVMWSKVYNNNTLMIRTKFCQKIISITSFLSRGTYWPLRFNIIFEHSSPMCFSICPRSSCNASFCCRINASSRPLGKPCKSSFRFFELGSSFSLSPDDDALTALDVDGLTRFLLFGFVETKKINPKNYKIFILKTTSNSVHTQ